MSEWRRKAIELFPERRPAIERAESVGLLWDELGDSVWQHYRNLSDQSGHFIPAIYTYLKWCLRSRSVDTHNAACIGFAESLAWFAVKQDEPTYQHITCDIAANFDPLEIRELAPCLAIALGPGRTDKLLADLAEARREHLISFKKSGRTPRMKSE